MPRHTVDQPRDEVVLMGASNLTRSISTASRTARAIVGRPCNLALVLGHGRSYGIWSNILGRSLPPILDCEVWETWKNRTKVDDSTTADDPNGAAITPPRRFALITDVGNDIAYGRLPEEIEKWLSETVVRLEHAHFTIVMSALPIDSLNRMSQRTFELIRRLFFPTKPLGYETAMSRIEELDTRMRDLARRTGIRFVDQRGQWFGIDPIHIKRSSYPEAWAWLMSHWLDDEARKSKSPSLHGVNSIPTWWSLRLASPAYRRVFGFEQRCAQPVRRWSDGTEVSLY